MNVHIQIPSTRPTTRGLSSPRRIISTHPLSPRARVKKIRRLPSLDTRSLLANPNLEYAQPAYILEQKLQISQQVEQLRKEVSLLRENYQIILSTLNDSRNDDNTNSSQNGEIENIYDEMAQHELSKKLSNYQAEYDELERRISAYNSSLTENTQFELNNYVTAQRGMQTQLESEIEAALRLIEEKNELLITKVSENYTEKVDANQIKITQLTELLLDLQKEEQLMLQLHQDMCKPVPVSEELKQEYMSCQRKLQMLQHSHARKLVDVKKLQKEQQQEKIALFAVKQTREENERKRRERIASQLIYKKRAEMLEESSRAVSEIKKNEKNEKNKKNENNEKLTTTKRRKHKHKHWHHHRQDDESSTTENGNNSQNDIVVDEGIDLVPKPNTFKTEVEKVNSLCIREGAE